jgi:membrane dipeptidase
LRFPRVLLMLLFAGALAAQTTPAPRPHPAVPPPKNDWRTVHDSAIVIDTHADTPQRFLDQAWDIGSTDPNDTGDLSLAKAKAGNLGAEFFSIWVEPVEYKGEYAHRTLALIDSVYRQAEHHPNRMMMAFSSEDIERAHELHKLAALMGIEGGHSIENDLGLLRLYYRLGVRYMTLTWSNSNEWAGSSGDQGDLTLDKQRGLTDFGRDVVREMNRLGMIVDISHVSDKTFYDTIAVTKAPVIASHSSCRALTNHPRNMTDDMLRAVQKNGGVVMVNFFSGFDSQAFLNAFRAQAKDRDAAVKQAEADWKRQHPDARHVPFYVYDDTEHAWGAKVPRPPLTALIDNIDHVVKIAGIDHVGLGSDFDGVSNLLPEGIDSAADLPKISQALMERGYSAEDIRKVLGGNLLRVFREVERVSKQLQSQPEKKSK